MNSNEFETVLQDVIRSIRQTLGHKASEYATDDDRLHNFKMAAALTGETQAQALRGMLVKHTVSVYDLMAKADTTEIPMELWDEKITDHINYLILLKAIVVEERKPTPASIIAKREQRVRTREAAATANASKTTVKAVHKATGQTTKVDAPYGLTAKGQPRKKPGRKAASTTPVKKAAATPKETPPK